MLKIDGETRRYVLAVLPGDRRVDLDAVRCLYGARYAGFCDGATAAELARTQPGIVRPFVMHDGGGPSRRRRPFRQRQVYFNAARLDRSVCLDVGDYRRMIRNARIEHIATT
jgi:Ala-tRNA(Pro) deacylase